ncbi:FecR domain-containing protein [Asticcacaulis sp. BYS171W]|uniref:FecR domain-containing protein n=1 Tax=Asticcacaulis aquaticus TaxID=2984212 RepID=A0ABT5HYF1_9CAUL|nr:FecR domain-containing protein [Asticcacaulis aquaticus]MDC7685112.1 FecR domain-containing protein [Asticcacaulis aquaticus]
MSAIDDIAVRWVATQASGVWDADLQARLDAWLSADTRHQGAFFRAQAAWAMMDRASVMGAGIDAAEISPPPFDAESVPDTAPDAFVVPLTAAARPTRRGLLSVMGGGAVAASLTAAFVLAAAVRDRVDLETEVGELRKVPLKDKSVASVNTDSRIEVSLKPDRRDVRLVRGEAWFEVAKDKARPFVVAADTVRVRAVGTAFSVRKLATGAVVLVSEGVVEVWNHKIPDRPARLTAGSRAFVPYAPAPVEAEYRPEAVDRALAWRDGQIAFDNDTLQSAVAEFNRYNAQKIVVADPALNAEKLVGWFRADQPETFARAVHGALNVPVTVDGDRIVIG